MSMNVTKGVKGFTRSPVEARFWAKVERRGPDECWLWTGSKVGPGGGYGTLWSGERNVRATQISWSIANGRPFPAGKMACHSCDNPPCVNPAHIWPGTMSENIRDAINKGRFVPPGVRGVPNSNSRKSHCLRGHSFDHRSLRRGGRRCRQCAKITDGARLAAIRKAKPQEERRVFVRAFREKILALAASGLSTPAIAKELGFHPATVRRVRQQALASDQEPTP